MKQAWRCNIQKRGAAQLLLALKQLHAMASPLGICCEHTYANALKMLCR
jgi:hypothetical protein